MRLRCAFNRSEMLADHQRGRVADVDSVYPLSVGVEYVVVGMGLWENVLSVLVRDDWGKPCFAPAGLFELGVHDVPADWRFGLCSGIRASGRGLWTDPCGAVWGYQELVDDPAHPAALEERDAAALMIFASRFAEAEDRAESS
jgi:hypothetical protein